MKHRFKAIDQLQSEKAMKLLYAYWHELERKEKRRKKRFEAKMKVYARFGRLMWDWRVGGMRIYHAPDMEIKLESDGWRQTHQGWPFVQILVER